MKWYRFIAMDVGENLIPIYAVKWPTSGSKDHFLTMNSDAVGVKLCILILKLQLVVWLELPTLQKVFVFTKNKLQRSMSLIIRCRSSVLTRVLFLAFLFPYTRR